MWCSSRALRDSSCGLILLDAMSDGQLNYLKACNIARCLTSPGDYRCSAHQITVTNISRKAPRVLGAQREVQALRWFVACLKVAPLSSTLMSCCWSKYWSQHPGSMSGASCTLAGRPSSWSAPEPGKGLLSGMVPAICSGTSHSCAVDSPPLHVRAQGKGETSAAERCTDIANHFPTDRIASDSVLTLHASLRCQ